jgi:Tfp pilus assembly protein PilW
MKRPATNSGKVAGFTLVETMAALPVSAFILLGVLMATAAFQKVFVATDEYFKATSDQMRVLDSIALDMRRASSGSVSNSGQTLTLILPDYIDYSQSPPVPRTPTIAANSTVTYGAAGSQPTAVYAVTGSSPNQTIRRTFTASSGTVTVSTLTSTATQFQFAVFDPANPGSTANFSFGGASQPSSISAQVNFMPRFTRLNLASTRTGTKASMTMYLRNHL